MSTRGFVAIGTNEKWEGRYNHYDSYPTGLGKEVWETAKRFLEADGHLKGFASRLLGFTDWRQMETDGICPYCGKRTGQPHSISGNIYFAAIEHPGEYPDPEARYHGHTNPDNPEEYVIDPQNVDWLFMKWAYIIDPDTCMMHIIKGGIETPIEYTEIYIRPDGRKDRYSGQKRHTFCHFATLDIRGEEPDWEALQAQGEDAGAKLKAEFQKLGVNHPALEALRQLPKTEVYDQRARIA